MANGPTVAAERPLGESWAHAKEGAPKRPRIAVPALNLMKPLLEGRG